MRKNALALILLCAALLLTGCGGEPVAETEATEATVAATVPADGDPNDVTCKGTYTAAREEAAAAADYTVALAGDAKLTMAQLQAAYWLEVAAYRQSGQTPQPDYTLGLDTQSCGIDSSINSWQQYFLREALEGWAVRQALVNTSATQKLPTEKAYNPVVENHEKYLQNIPATRYLYGYNDSWQPNEMHQQWLDEIPRLLDTLAPGQTFADPDALAEISRQYNLAYMYLTERGYDLEPTGEEILLRYEQDPDAYASVSGEDTVDLRHILVVPEGARVAPDGTVTASEEQWKAAQEEAKRLHRKWKNSNYHREAEFAVIANEESDDAGSRVNGGLYQNLKPGMLAPELEEWCFAEDRKAKDTAVIRSACGYHVLYLSRVNRGPETAIRQELLEEGFEALFREATEGSPLKVVWGSIALEDTDMQQLTLTFEDLLYPDVAHQRYPTIPLYLQQDYPDTYYGAYKIRTHGCGITTLAMIASYFTDEEWTPPELCDLYGRYCGEHGTNIKLFDDEPADLGFFLERRSYNWNDILQAIEDGHVVVSLQYEGYWTRGGHFLAIQEMNEDGLLVIRDSNIFNYGKLSGHYVDAFDPDLIPPAGMYHWIYQKKITTIPACVRCGEDGAKTAPQIMFRQDYTCGKCVTAVARRDSYLASPAA